MQLLQSLELDEKARGTASSLLNEVRNLSDMVTSFLNFARPQPLELDEVNLNELIAGCGNDLTIVFDERNVTLTISKGANEAPILNMRADERMLRQALLNLIRNAAEAIPESKMERHVEVVISTERDTGKTTTGRWLRLQILVKEFLRRTCSVFSFRSSQPRRPATA